MSRKYKIFKKNFRKHIDKCKSLWYNIQRSVQNRMSNKRCWCGSMAEQLICNQQVVGSTPITSSNGVATAIPILGDFPSGQRGQTVNLLSLTSVVRIHHPPPTKRELLSTKSSLFVYPSRRLGISSAPTGLDIITATPCISSRFSVHIPAAWWYTATSCGWYTMLRIDDIHAFGVIGMRECGKLLNCFTKYDIMHVNSWFYHQEREVTEWLSMMIQL